MKTVFFGLLAYLAACVVVGFVWAVFAVITSGWRGALDALQGWIAISGIVSIVALIPTAIVRFFAWWCEGGSTWLAMVTGGVIGAVLFLATFGAWIGTGQLGDLAVVFLSGAGLGALGGFVYWRSEQWLLGTRPNGEAAE